MRRSRLLKVLVAILLVAGLLVASSATALSPTTVKLWIGNGFMSVNSVQRPIDAQGTKPVIVEGRTLVPIRADFAETGIQDTEYRGCILTTWRQFPVALS